MAVIDAWDNEAVEAALRKQGLTDRIMAGVDEETRRFLNERLDVAMAELRGVAAPLVSQQDRIAALEALCEELLDEVSLLNERAPMAEYRARLAQLKGAG